MPGLISLGSDIIPQPSPEGATQLTLYRPFGAYDSGKLTIRWLRHRHRLFRAFGPEEIGNIKTRASEWLNFSKSRSLALRVIGFSMFLSQRVPVQRLRTVLSMQRSPSN